MGGWERSVCLKGYGLGGEIGVVREKKKSGTSRKKWAERKMWEKRRGEGEGEEMCREEGTGVVERARAETIRRHG